jgi:ABC-2 type transport system permease protein
MGSRTIMPIFDQGYQHWKGTLSGRAWRWLAIARHGVRGQIRGRPIRLLLLAAWMPALTLAGALAVWGLFEQGTEGALELLQPLLPSGVAADPRAYRQAVWTIAYSTFFKTEIFFIMALVVVAGPNLISRDLRFNALPLYFSRPLTRLDYFLGKLGVLAALVAAVAVGPAVAAYALGVCFSLELSVVRDTWRLLPASILYGLVIVASAGPLMLALSSLSRRSLYVGIAWAGLWVISSTVAGALGSIHHSTLLQNIARQEMVPLGPDAREPSRRRGHGFHGPKWQSILDRVEDAEAQAAPTNWRPLCSYTANLERLGEALLDTDKAWVTMGRAIAAPRAALTPFFGLPAKPSPRAERRLADKLVPQYPWKWSAGVLTGLLGLSLWTLSIRVKSLDRLR